MSDELVPAEHVLDAQSFYSEVYCKGQEALRDIALAGRLGRLRNRFIVWRVFLGVFDETQPISQWIEVLREQRAAYKSMQESYKKVCVQDLDPLIFNPLSQSIENPWNSFYQDNELKQIIRNDIDRTLQERSLFQQEETKEMMVRILFAWAKNNIEISYRQGMNELLAIFLIIAYSERCEEMPQIPLEAAKVLQELNDPEFTEADVYSMFCRLMDLGVKELFLPVLSAKPKNLNNLLSFDRGGYENDLINSDKTNEASASKILKRCHRIHHRFLQALDKQLYNYIESQKIEPQIYLQRWVRCLLTREFNLSDTLALWDSIFACANLKLENKTESYTGKLDFSAELIMLDFLCVAMIVFVRGFCKEYLVLQCDATGIMRRLLKFPPVEDVGILLSMAKSFKERVLNGKGVSIPHLIEPEDDPLRCKSEKPKTEVILMAPARVQKFSERIDIIVEMLQQQNSIEKVDVKKMNEAYALLSGLREDLTKVPRKVR